MYKKGAQSSKAQMASRKGLVRKKDRGSVKSENFKKF